jgi:Type II secretion system (T2SS), protein E, N-terminal domain
MEQAEHFIVALCAILEQNKVIKPGEAASLRSLFANRSPSRFEDFLLEERIILKEDLLKALSMYYKLPALDVVGVFFEHHLVRMFPKDTMILKGFIPYERDDDILIVVASQPDDDLVKTIAQSVSYEVAFFVGIHQDIVEVVEEFYDTPVTDEETDVDRNEEERDARSYQAVINEEETE